jgi:hypothetical protein
MQTADSLRLSTHIKASGLRFMYRDQYIIQQYTFDIGFYDQAKVHALQNMFSKLFYDQAMPVMETVFENRIPANQLVQCNRLEINIGSIPYERVNKDFADRFKEALEKELTLLLAAQEAAAPNGVAATDAITGSLVSLLEYFLITGSLPWWASQQTTAGPVQVLEQVMQQAPAQLLQLVLRTGEHDYVRRRLVYQFPESTLQGVISLLQPEQASFIFSYHKNTSDVQQREKIINSELRAVEKALWIFILDYLLTEHGNYFNRKTFVRHTLQQMALHFNVSYKYLLGLLAAAVQKNELNLQPVDALPVIIHELVHEQNKQPGHELLTELAGYPGTEMITPTQVQQHLDVVRYYLLFGSLPAWAASVDKKRLLQLFAQAMDQVPVAVKHMIAVLAIHQPVQERMATVLDDVAIQKVIRMEEPAEADFIIRYVNTLQVQQHKRSLVKAEGNEFRKSVWQFVLAFLYTEKGSVFNSRMFLKSHIHRLAQHYRLAYGQMLVFLVQGMGEEMQATDDSSLFHLLVDLLQEYRQQQNDRNVQGPAVEVMQQTGDDTLENTAILMRDILGFWLLYDRYPWWNTIYRHRSPGSLWNELVRLSPHNAQWLVRSAMQQEPAIRRLINSFPVDDLLPVFRLLNNGHQLVQAYTSMITALEMAMPQQVRNRQQARAGLLLVVWQVWQAGYYTAIDTRALVTKSIAWIAGFTNVTADTALQSVIQYLEKEVSAAAMPFAEVWHAVQKETVIHKQLYAAGYLPVLGTSLEETIETDRNSGKQLLDAVLFHINKGSVKQWLRTSLQSPVVARFIVQSYAAERAILFIERLFAAQAAETVVLLRTIEKLLEAYVTDTLERDRFQLLLWEFTLVFLATGQPVNEPTAFFGGWARFLTQRRAGLIHLLHASLANTVDHHVPFMDVLRQQVQQEVTSQQAQTALPAVVQDAYRQQMALRTGTDVNKQREEELEQITRELAVKQQQAADEQKQQAKKRVQAENATLYVSNAGLVLLHPFLSTLFTRLQLVEKSNFINEAAQHRAIHLLQFLVSGQQQHPEHQLALNKLLCGFPLEEPVTAAIELTPAEKSTAGELLQVVLQRWEKLKNTSVEGLRVSFLQRTGALIPSPDHWTLRVEQRGIDVLLPFLPWSFGVIKTSWMKKTLFVEWT